DGQSPLEHLGVGQARVGHVGLHDGGAGEAVAGPRSGGDGLVVLVAGVAEGDVVHGAGALRLDAERRVEGAGDGLGGLDVARDDGGGRFGGQHGPGRHDDRQGPQAPVVEGDVVGDEGAEDVQDGRVDDGERGVEVGGQLGGRAGEVDGRGAVGAVDAHAHADDRARVGLVGVLAVVEGVDDAPHRLLGVVLDVLLVGGGLGAQGGEVGGRVAGGVGRGGQQAERVLLQETAVLGEQPVVEEDALLLDGAAVGGHGAGGDAADLGVVAA